MSAVLDGHPRLRFDLPAELEAASPPEARGLGREGVRMMVGRRDTRTVDHARFRDLRRFLAPGDLLVINTSQTMPASLPATGRDGEHLRLHVSTRLPNGHWLVELRRPAGAGTEALWEDRPEVLTLPGGGRAFLVSAFQRDGTSEPAACGARLWEADLRVPGPLLPYLEGAGAPIRYRHADHAWPIESYRTVYGTDVGSAEMPSAGRPFTPEAITELVAGGVLIAPIVLHSRIPNGSGFPRPRREWSITSDVPTHEWWRWERPWSAPWRVPPTPRGPFERQMDGPTWWSPPNVGFAPWTGC